MFLRWALLLVLGALGACSSTPDGGSLPTPEAAAPPTGLSKEAQLALAKRGIQPHDTSPVNVASRCNRVDEIGTRTQLNLAVDDGVVNDFTADVAIKGRGQCHFALADFEQAARRPDVILRHRKDGKCTVRMWREQREQVTIAFNSCRKSCEGKAFDYLWPILVNAKTGQCF